MRAAGSSGQGVWPQARSAHNVSLFDTLCAVRPVRDQIWRTPILHRTLAGCSVRLGCTIRLQPLALAGVEVAGVDTLRAIRFVSHDCL